MSDPVQHNLEGRIGKVETHLDGVTRQIGSLTTDIKELAQSVRLQGENTESQIRGLLVAVTTAGGPKAVDWMTIWTAIGVIFTIGIAAFTPMVMSINNLSTNLEKTQIKMEQNVENFHNNREKIIILEQKLTNKTKE